MRAFIVLLVSLAAIQGASAATMARCSVTTKFQNVRGVNLLIQASNKTSAFLFANGSPAIRLEGSTTVSEKSEMWLLANGRPAGERKVRLVRSSVKNPQLTVNTELRFQEGYSNKSVSGSLIVKGQNMNLICDITEE